jgi:hypothetical protein
VNDDDNLDNLSKEMPMRAINTMMISKLLTSKFQGPMHACSEARDRKIQEDHPNSAIVLPVVVIQSWS